MCGRCRDKGRPCPTILLSNRTKFKENNHFQQPFKPSYEVGNAVTYYLSQIKQQM